MRILLLSTSYLPLIGGSEMAIKEVTDRLTDVEFDLITWRSNLLRREHLGRVNVYRVGAGRLSKLFLPLLVFRQARRLIRAGTAYDAVHVFQASQVGGAVWFLKRCYPRLPVILTLQEGQDLAAQ